MIIFGDFNEASSSSKLLQQLHYLGLRDIHATQHPGSPLFRTYNRGRKVIDYVFCSQSILPSVINVAYEPFSLTTTSDHRGIILDLDSKTVWGRKETIAPAHIRDLSSSDIPQTEKFLTYLEQFWRQYDIPQRIDKAKAIQNRRTLRLTIDDIDKDITRAFLQAEKRIKKKPKPPWSPELKQASLRVKFYKLVRQEEILQTNLSAAIDHTISLMDEPPPRPATPQEGQQLLRKAQKLLRTIRRKAQSKREEYLEQLRQKYGLLDDDKMQKIILRIQKAEATKRCYRKLRWITKPQKPGVTFIERTTNNGTECIFDRQALEAAILERNQMHFNQCAGTPFTVGPLRKLRWAADSELAERILQGIKDFRNITEDTLLQKVLSECQAKAPEVSDEITTEDLKQLFQIWRETTTTSPSGRHLGIYKAVFQTTNNNNSPYPFDQHITRFLNIIIQNSIGPKRWRKVTNMMIHKLEGSFNINKLRVIHLFEADYNGLIGILFNRRVLYNAEKRGILNDNQWGARPHRQAEDALLLKELTYNMASMTKTTLATFDNDATGCFDRVPCSVAMISSRRLGATKNMCRLQADVLRHIQHRVRTAFGTSVRHYTSTDACEIHGQGQGSRAGPPTWAFVSSLLLDCMTKFANGVRFTCPNQQVLHQRTNDAFVDDVTGYSNSFIAELQGEPVLADVLRRMQSDASLWNDLLHISGGKLALHKCLYYVMAWTWDRGTANILPANQIEPTITLSSPNGHALPIKHVDCTTAHRTLGQHKTPSGDTSAHLRYIQTKSNDWLHTIKEANLTKTEALAAFETMWFPSISYGLGTVNLTYKELNNIQKPIVNYILPLLGYNRHLPRAVVFGSSSLGGLNFKHLYIHQGTMHVTQFIKHYRSGGNIGKLLQIALRWLRLIAGFSFCPLRRPQANYHHIEDKWFGTTIRFLHECNAWIETDDNIQIYSRTQDSSLMEDFLLLDPSPGKLKLLNQCRLFLRVTSLSDICTENGDKLTRNCWEGTDRQPSPLLWPCQHKPSTKAWRIWRSFLSKCYLAEESHLRRHHNLSLSSPLGPWLPYHHDLQLRRNYIHPIHYTVYQRQHQQTDNPIFIKYSPCRTSRTHLTYSRTGQTTYIPRTAIPIQCHSNDSHIRINKKDIPRTFPQNDNTKHTNFNEFLQQLDLWEYELLRYHSMDHPLDDTTTRLLSPIIIASDGSVRQPNGTFGWIITSTDGSPIARGSGQAFGHNISSFRAEAYGILGALRFLLRMFHYHNTPLPNRTTTWWCDSESLLKRIQSNLNDTINPNRYKDADHDLEQCIILTIPLVTTTLTQQHIRSHQSDNTPLHLLPLPQRLNRIADELATAHYTHIDATKGNRVPLITPARCQLHTSAGTITRSYLPVLHRAYTEQTTRQHISKRFNLERTQVDTIEWRTFGKAFRKLKPGHQRIIRRWMYGYLPTQRRLHRYNPHISNLCPLCRTQIETDHHFLICGGSDTWEDTLFVPIETLCRKYKQRIFCSHFLDNTRSFIRGLPTNPALKQSSLGWTTIFYGLLHTEWETIHQQTSSIDDSLLDFLTQLVSIILKAIVDRWKLRNQTLHHTEADTPEVRQRLITQIKALYECHDRVLPTDRVIFQTPLTELLQSSTRTMQLFMQQNKTLVKHSIKLYQAQQQRQHRDIASYFIRNIRITRVTQGR